MHDQKWGEDSDKPIITMTKHSIKTHTMDYMSLANHILKTIVEPYTEREIKI
jgi:hypothetical protein